jgi:aminoglycoside 6'-N-acetyltransferase I
MTIEIKLLREGDEAVLVDVTPEVFDDPIDPGATAEFLRDPRHHVAVAIDDGSVVGFVSAVHYIHPDKARPEMWINEVGVATTHRQRGLARALLEAVVEKARELGCSEAWVLTARSNPAGMALYAAAGGEENEEDAVMFTFRIP